MRKYTMHPEDHTSPAPKKGSKQPPLEQIISHYSHSVGTPVAQLTRYKDLNDYDRETVDFKADEEFEKRSLEFEQEVGSKAAGHPDSKEAADELLDRTVLLSEVMYFNTPQTDYDASLDKQYATVFGIRERPDITGGVGDSIQFIHEVIEGGTFREKMSLYYVALAENQTLNKLLIQYKGMLDKEIADMNDEIARSTDSAIKEKENAYINKLIELQGFGESRTDETQPVKEGYLGEKRKKAFFLRAMRWVEMEIQLERNAWERSGRKKGASSAKILTPEKKAEQKEQDRLLALEIVDKLSGGKLDSELIPYKKGGTVVNDALGKAYREEVEKRIKSQYITESTDSTASSSTEEQIAYQKYKDESVRKLELFMEEYRQGKGLLNLLMEQIFADNYPIYEAELFTAMKDQKIENKENLIKKIKEETVRKAFATIGNTIFDAGKRKPDSVLKAALQTELYAILDKSQETDTSLTSIASKTASEEKNKEKGITSDKMPEEMASERFNMEFTGPSVFSSKKVVTDSRKGDARSLNPTDQQISGDTPNMLEAQTGMELTYREMGALFYTREQIAEMQGDIDLQDEKHHPDPQKIKRKMLTEHGQDKLPWKPGMNFWKIDTKSPLKEVAGILRVAVGAAVSGSTDRIMRGAKYFGFDDAQMKKVLLACLGWMIPARDHTYYEIMKAAEPYLGTLPPFQPGGNLIVDVNYAEGGKYGEMKNLLGFTENELPGYLLSEQHKDKLADKLFPNYAKSPDSTLRILSSHEGKIVFTEDKTVYRIRSKDTIPAEYTTEWYWLRMGSTEARGNFANSGPEFQRQWGYEGLYKIYCLLIDNNHLPVAALRYNQVVHRKTASETASVQIPEDSAGPLPGLPESKETTVDPPTVQQPVKKTVPTADLQAKAIYNLLSGERRILPVTLKFKEETAQVTCTLTAPANLDPANDLQQEWTGVVSKKLPQDNPQQSAIITMFNQLYRKRQDQRSLQADAAWEAVNSWGKSVTDGDAGAVNVDIFDPETHIIVKENYFYVDSAVTQSESKGKFFIPAFRTQGGDFKSGVKSSVRFVNTTAGKMDISGQAMVWVNFGDKERLVWWLNNRTDRSYSVAFNVSSEFLRLIAANRVEEKDANQTGNKGKPIISQDKAAHQYAISSKPTLEKNPYADMDQLRSYASGMLMKIFQWKTFDIQKGAPQTFYPEPENGGMLMQPFNETLRQAKDKELKIRFLEATDPSEPQLPDLKVEQAQLEKAGREEWKDDYYHNLRKPKGRNISKADNRVISELSSRELFDIRFELMDGIKDLKQIKNKLDELVSAAFTTEPTIEYKNFENLSGQIKQKVKEWIIPLQDYPPELAQDMCYYTINSVILSMLKKYITSYLDSIDEKKREESEQEIKKLFTFTYQNEEFGTKPTTPTPQKKQLQSAPKKQPALPRQLPQKISTGVAPIKSPVSVSSPQPISVPVTKPPLGGMENAGNTCYLAAAMQIIASIPDYANLFKPLLVYAPKYLAVHQLGQTIIEAINKGETVKDYLMVQFRRALIDIGWISNEDEKTQQDAGELLRFLLDSLLNYSGDMTETHTRTFTDKQKLPETSSTHHNVFATGALEKAEVDNSKSVQSLIDDHFTQPDQEGDTIHNYRIQTLPSHLNVQIGRYTYQPDRQSWIHCEEIIQVNDTLILRDEEGVTANYTLTGFIVHQGASLWGGHYIAYIRKGTEWFRADDADVKSVPPTIIEEKKKNAYICHYSKT